MPDISKRLEKAERHLQRGKPDAALEEYLAALEEDPKNDKVRQTAADLCLAVGRNAEAGSLLGQIFDEQISSGDAGGVVTYKKLLKISSPTPMQTFHYAQLVVKRDKKDAVEAYELALKGFETQGRDKQALIAIKQIVELAPTPENLQRAGEKAAFMGEGTNAALNFVQLGMMKEQQAPGSGFPWFEKAYNYDPANPQAILLYARGLFSHSSLNE